MRTIPFRIILCIIWGSWAMGCSKDSSLTPVTSADRPDEKAKEQLTNKNKEMIVGSWWLVKRPSLVIEFSKHGTLKLTEESVTSDGAYEVDADKLTTTIQGGKRPEKQTGTIHKLTESDLTLEDEQGGWKFGKLRKLGPGSDAERAVALAEYDLKGVGIYYYIYLDGNGDEAPKKAEDFARTDLRESPRLMNLLRSGEIVFIYNVKLAEMTDGPARTVLAYMKETPTKGGLVLMGSGQVVRMTAEEYKKATLAKPKGK